MQLRITYIDIPGRAIKPGLMLSEGKDLLLARGFGEVGEGFAALEFGVFDDSCGVLLIQFCLVTTLRRRVCSSDAMRELTRISVAREVARPGDVRVTLVLSGGNGVNADRANNGRVAQRRRGRDN